MIVVLLNTYLVLLFILVRLKIVPFNLFWKVSPVLVLFLLLFGLFIPMNWGAPQGSAVVVRHSVAIVPDVAGEVLDVPVEPNKPLKAGDVLFFNGSVIHGSYENTSKSRFRRSFISHYVPRSSSEVSEWYRPLYTFEGCDVAMGKATGGGPCGGEEAKGPH